MIEKIELIESSMFLKSYLIEKDKISYYFNAELKDEVMFNGMERLEDLIRTYTLLWNSEYVNEGVLDGLIVTLNIYTEEETITYYFNNRFPSNYDYFIKEFKKVLGNINE